MVLQAYEAHTRGYEINCTSVRAILSMIVSIVAFFVIWIIDCVFDRTEDRSVEAALRSIIKAIGVLIGFSWEQAFASGVESIVLNLEGEGGAHHGGHEGAAEGEDASYLGLIIKCGMAAALGIVVIPAWRKYILRSVLRLRRKHEAMKHKHETEQRQDDDSDASDALDNHSEE